jgi:hypothetical protein
MKESAAWIERVAVPFRVQLESRLITSDSTG